VVLPVRNGTRTLDAAIRSVLASRNAELELVCVNDGSWDDTPEILRAWARHDSRVRVLHQAAGGIVSALNTGLAQARAPLVARMDADDEIHPDRLAAQATFLDDHPELTLVGCRVESFRDDGLAEGYRRYSEWVNRLVAPDEIEREAFIECPIPHPTWMFRRSPIIALGGYQERAWPEDLDLIYRLLGAGHRLGKVPRLLHRWRDHSNRLSRRDPRYGREAFSRVKAHYIGRIHPMPAAIVWGAGRTGRRLARWLRTEGLQTQLLLDVNPARVGSTWQGIPILSPTDLKQRAHAWRQEGLRILAAVARRGAREEIRQELVAHGLREGEDFLMMA
jgi:glycosyltransferase involved in cell wall biosynthesis